MKITAETITIDLNEENKVKIRKILIKKESKEIYFICPRSKSIGKKEFLKIREIISKEFDNFGNRRFVFYSSPLDSLLEIEDKYINSLKKNN